MKSYLYGGLLALFLASHIWAKYHWDDVYKAKANKAALEYRENENKLLAQLEEAKKKREIVYKERIVQVDKVVDDCLDRPLPDDIKRLFDAQGRETQPTDR